MRHCLFALAVLAAPVLTGAAFADETSDLLGKADQAFAAADYQTAAALYSKLDGQITDTAKKSAMEDRLRFAKRQILATASANLPATASPATQPTAASPATQPVSASAAVSTGVATSAATRTPHVRPAAGQVMAMTLHELGNFDYNEDDDKTIPADVRKLDGATVKIEGVMMPLDQAGRVSRFMLVNDMMSCCYGTAPKLQNVAMVELPKDKWLAATTDRIAVTGKLKVTVQREDGFVLSIFQIEPTSIKLVAE